MKRYLIPILLLVAIGAMVYFSTSSGPSPDEYAAFINSEREKKEAFLRRDPESPFRAIEDSIKPLVYYPPDLKFRVLASLEPVQQKQVRILQTSTGEQARYLDYAWAMFELEGTECKLLILEVMDMGPNRGKLFLAFADETSAKETYGGGRYLDLKKVPAATSIELDFNKAYNPYCAYNENYSCPLPPRENLMNVAIRAGEKSYH
ncbi:MAG: DUF1684 domain-containing protein [Cyclobacteriaceae bacterium]|nr:DUF1684 domain-containing protein [Cyclobacteriaceae bacterium]